MLSKAEREFLRKGKGKYTAFIKTNYLYVLQNRIIKKIRLAIRDFRLILEEGNLLDKETDLLLKKLEKKLIDAIKQYVRTFLYE